MVVVKIYGMKGSSCTQRVIIVCNELSIDYELVIINLATGEQRKPEYLEKMIPFPQVPVLEDEDGIRIFESRAIARYLVAKYGKQMTLMPNPSDHKAYAMFEQAASVEYSSFDPPTATLVGERVIFPKYGMPVDEAAAVKAEGTLKSKLEGYERILANQKYLAGELITLADLFHIPPGAYLDSYNPDILRASPNVKRWWEEISARPSWKGFQ